MPSEKWELGTITVRDMENGNRNHLIVTGIIVWMRAEPFAVHAQKTQFKGSTSCWPEKLTQNLRLPTQA